MNRSKYESLVKFHPKVGEKLRVNSSYGTTFSSARVEEITKRHIVASGPVLGDCREFDRITLKNKNGRTIEMWTEEDDLYVEWCRVMLTVRWALRDLSSDFEEAARPALEAKRADKVITKGRLERLKAMVESFRTSFQEELTR